MNGKHIIRFDYLISLLILLFLLNCKESHTEELKQVDKNISEKIDSIMNLEFVGYQPKKHYWVNDSFFIIHPVTSHMVKRQSAILDTIVNILSPICDTMNPKFINNLNVYFYYHQIKQYSQNICLADCDQNGILGIFENWIIENNLDGSKDLILKNLKKMSFRLSQLKLCSILLEYGYRSDCIGSLVFVEFAYDKNPLEYAIFDLKLNKIKICSFD